MTKKIRLTRTTIFEYEPEAKYYEEGFTIEQMAEFDANADDRDLLFSQCDSDEVKWEIIITPE